MKITKYLLCFITLSCLIYIYPQPIHKYSDIFFLNSTHGWIVGTQNYIWKTTNSGESWSSIYDDRISPPARIFFLNEQKGWLLVGAKLYSTEDGGSNWTFKYELPQLLNTLINIHFIDDTVGFIANNKLYKTTDSGNSWSSILDTLPGICNLSFYNNYIGFIGTVQQISYLYKTTNIGSSWILSFGIGTINGSGFSKIQALNDSVVFAAYYLPDWVIVGSLVKSTDGGNFWNIINSSPFGIRDFEFINDNQGWISRYSGSILTTANGGLRWDTLQSPSPMKFKFFNPNISFGISETHVYSTSDGWTTYSVVDSLFTDIREQENILSDYCLFQNYPNPFNPSTIIKFEIPRQSWVTLKIYNMLGEEVRTLVNSEKDSGIYEMAFDASLLPSGIYICQLQAGEFVESRKMLLLR